MDNLKILFGVCGIGKGHIYEMLPIIEHYVKQENSEIVIFAFGVSYPYFLDKYSSLNNVDVFEVSVPWIHGDKEGIDYINTAVDDKNRRSDYIEKNFLAMDKVKSILGKPSVVITDYEPVSALYAYSTGSPLVTIDQQSKYLFSGYISFIENLTPREECARLGMFFPRADLRIITSFFKLPSCTSEFSLGNFVVHGSVIRDEILNLKDVLLDNSKNVLIYLSPYSDFVQKPEDLMLILKELPEHTFYIFTTNNIDYLNTKEKFKINNVYIENFGDKNFLDVLKKCRSVICTAGHTLLSELMYLGKPVLAVPLGTYEQQYSAWVINNGKFGSMAKYLTVDNVNGFLSSLDIYEKSIETNKGNQLYRLPAQSNIIKEIDGIMLQINKNL